MEPESILSAPSAIGIPDQESREVVAEETRAKAEAPTRVSEWSLAKLLAFRLAFIYFVAYALPFPFGTIPVTEKVAAAYEKIWQWFVPWVAQHILHIGYQVSSVQTGSGDTTYAWVRNFCYVVLAVAGTLAWSWLDRKRLNYERLHHWLRLYVRLYVGAIMISYGSYKVIQSQFPAPNLGRLVQPYGDSSPMGLLWTFMGASYAYNLFTGAAEILGGALLIIPPLATLGALVTIAAMGNVFILNMAYDVPVKLFSFNLILMAAFIALPDAGRLASVLVLNRKTEPVPPRPLFARLRLNDAMRWLQLILLVVFLGASLYQSWQGSKFWASVAVPPAIHGIWSVHEVTVDGQPRPPTMSDARRWQRVVVEYSNRLTVQLMDAPLQRYSMELDPENKTVKLTGRDDPTWKADFKYEVSPPNVMVWKGEMDGHNVAMTMQRKELSEFRLLNRGFHWISEAPFNR